MREKVIEILNKYLGKVNDKNFYFYPDIPENKIKGAIEKYALSLSKEDVLFLIDDTLFGKADLGLLLTDRFLYGHEAFEGIVKLSFNHIEDVAVKRIVNTGLYINGNKVMTLTQPSKAAMSLFAEMLQEISVECNQNPEFSQSNERNSSLTIQESLIQLKSIFDMGLISQEEYDDKRKELLFKLK